MDKPPTPALFPTTNHNFIDNIKAHVISTSDRKSIEEIKAQLISTADRNSIKARLITLEQKRWWQYFL